MFFDAYFDNVLPYHISHLLAMVEKYGMVLYYFQREVKTMRERGIKKLDELLKEQTQLVERLNGFVTKITGLVEEISGGIVLLKREAGYKEPPTETKADE